MSTPKLSGTAVLRIFLRWNKQAAVVFCTAAPLALFAAVLMPLRYEATFEPMCSRLFLIFLALSGGMLLSAASILILELCDPTIRRLGDIHSFLPAASIAIIPAPRQDEAFDLVNSNVLSELLEAAREKMNLSGSVLIDILGEQKEPNDLGMAIAASLRELHYSVGFFTESNKTTLPEGSLDHHLAEMRRHHQAIIVVRQTKSRVPPTILAESDMACIQLSAGKTRRAWVAALARQLVRVPRKIFFVLDSYEDPIVDWIPAAL